MRSNKGIVLLAAIFILMSCQDHQAKVENATSSKNTAKAPAGNEDSAMADTQVSLVYPGSAAAAAEVVKAYYDAINERNYASAYQYWEDSGRASRQTYEEFKKGFADTKSVKLLVNDTGRVDAAAGSLYAEIAVTVNAVHTDGAEMHFKGKYVLRRAVANGATASQRQWHIYSAEMRKD